VIILDTNVLSEPMKPEGDPRIQAWIDKQDRHLLHITVMTLAELLLGIELLPHGKRRDRLAASSNELVKKYLQNRILHFDERAAAAYALRVSRARANGYTISIFDGQTAAIAAVHGFVVATRDVAPFVAAGVDVVNPWED
jgi:predicted nucleic acid-binding protein